MKNLHLLFQSSETVGISRIIHSSRIILSINESLDVFQNREIVLVTKWAHRPFFTQRVVCSSLCWCWRWEERDLPPPVQKQITPLASILGAVAPDSDLKSPWPPVHTVEKLCGSLVWCSYLLNIMNTFEDVFNVLLFPDDGRC